MPYRDKPEFRDETERLIWCTAFATHELRHKGRSHPFQDTVDARGTQAERVTPWHEIAREYADRVLDGYRKNQEAPR